MRTCVLVRQFSARAVRGLAAGVWLALAGSVPAADSLSDDFSNGIDPTRWTIRSNQNAFALDSTQGDIRISKPGGSAGALLQTGLAFWGELEGNFDTRVVFRNAALDWSQTGIGNQVQFWVTIGTQDYILVLGDEIIGRTVHVALSPACVLAGTRSSAATEGAFAFVRTGTVLDCYVDTNLVATFNCGPEPARVWFDLQNNYSGDPISVAFDDFSVTATRIRMLPPVFLQQPQSQLGYWGSSVSFQAETVGPSPFFLQWFRDGIPIAGTASNSEAWTDTGLRILCGDFIASRGFRTSIVLTNLQMVDAGAYTLVVTNTHGSMTSAPAMLTVNPLGVEVELYAGVTLRSAVGETYGIQSNTNLADTNNWIGLTNITLTQPTHLWYDNQPATHPRRFYRVVPGPISIP